MSLNNIICCCQLKQDIHLVQETIKLGCGHSICKKCFLIIQNNVSVFCAKCDKVTSILNQNNILSNEIQIIQTNTKIKMAFLKS